MSQMINDFNYLISQAILVIPKKQLILPKYKNLLRNDNKIKTKKSNILDHEQVIYEIFKNLTTDEMEKIGKENERVIRKKCSELKKKLRDSAQNFRNQKTLKGILQERKNTNQWNSLNNIKANACETVDISKKYRTKIAARMSVCQEVRQIQRNKQRYLHWHNSCNNSPLKSPNYTKMNYALEKIVQNKQWQDIVKKQNKINKIFQTPSYDQVWKSKQGSRYASRSSMSQFQKNVKIGLA